MFQEFFKYVIAPIIVGIALKLFSLWLKEKDDNN
ncbi:type I toxin-antitoxin system Fst family toxin [Lactococcus lactis]|uniref:Type I toxin-antitoxin system Fst family toxin n=1 Tax=Lactococcus lactis TaxID=1358 RepID=A0A9X4S5M8_9LACT|nr:type I toxin-antitoxin system Fst family toxin [Lactococcus lactis]MDG4984908.1 type I toxin-antitoxin system Fst family toxin [Lactococcus lactis]